MDRRRYLSVVAGASAAVAGCTDQSTTGDGTASDDGSTTDTDQTTTQRDGTVTEGESTTETGSGESTTEAGSSETEGVTGDGETGLDIRHVAGDQVTDEGIGRIRLLVVPAAEGAVDLSRVTIEWSGESGSATITHAGTDGDASFTVRPVQDGNGTLDGGRPVLDSTSEYADLAFEVPPAAGGPVGGGQTIDLTVRTAGGIESSGQLQTPTTLLGSPVTLEQGIEAETGETGTSSRIAVTAATGSVAERSVRTVTVTGRPASDGSEIELDRVVLRYLDPSGVYDITHEAGGSDGPTFTTRSDSDEEGQFEMDVDLTSLRGDGGLPAGEAAILLVMTPSGGTTTVTLVAPSSLPEDGEVAL